MKRTRATPRLSTLVAMVNVLVLVTLSVDGLSLTNPVSQRLNGRSPISLTPSTFGGRGIYSSQSSAPPFVTAQIESKLGVSTDGFGAADNNGEEKKNIRSRTRQTIHKISNKIRSSARGSKRALIKKKWMSLAMAFTTLFFITTGKHSSNVEHNHINNAASVAKTVVRGGAATTAQTAQGFLNRTPFKLFSRAKHQSSQSQPTSPVPFHRTIVSNWDNGLRGGGSKSKAPPPSNPAVELSEQTTRTLLDAFKELGEYMKGPKSDTLFLLLATSLITPLCKMAGTSPILGFLASGMLLGPNGFGVISGIHTTETLAELGIVFFLFEMGIELSVERLKSMKKDVFGLGLSQYTISALIMGTIAKVVGGLSGPASVVVGGALALSSSAFVLQLLKDKKELATRFGKASFGVLLLQDLAVVPLLVATPILAGSGSLASALGSATVKAALALSGIALAGRFAMNPLFKTVAAANSQEAFLGVILLTALGMSFLTEGLGLSNTLGAFLAGVLLSETKYKYQVEADIAPFRGILLGLFFVTVGFEIDVRLIASNLPVVASIVAGILGIKTAILTILSLGFGLSKSTAIRTGLILSQGGEFAFVAFGLARSLGILSPATTKMLLTSVSLTMALTPFLDEMGGKLAKKIEEGSDFTHYMGQDRDASEITEDDGFVVVVGYGVVGKVVCDLLDYKFIKYIGMEKNPQKAIQARNKGLPVFFGDVGRPEVCEAFKIGKAKAVIVTIAEKEEATRAVIALRRLYPDKQIFARAKDADHAKRLQSTLDVAAMVPILPEDNLLLTLPFGGAVLRSLGAPAEEVNYILAEKRKEVLSGKELQKYEEEAVLAQLGVEVPDDDEEDKIEEEKEDEKEEVITSSKYDAVVVKARSPDEQPLKKEETKAPAEGKAKEAEKASLKPLVQSVVEANYTPEKKVAEKKIDVEADGSDSSRQGLVDGSNKKKEISVME